MYRIKKIIKMLYEQTPVLAICHDVCVVYLMIVPDKFLDDKTSFCSRHQKNFRLQPFKGLFYKEIKVFVFMEYDNSALIPLTSFALYCVLSRHGVMKTKLI